MDSSSDIEGTIERSNTLLMASNDGSTVLQIEGQIKTLLFQYQIVNYIKSRLCGTFVLSRSSAQLCCYAEDNCDIFVTISTNTYSNGYLQFFKRQELEQIVVPLTTADLQNIVKNHKYSETKNLQIVFSFDGGISDVGIKKSEEVVAEFSLEHRYQAKKSGHNPTISQARIAAVLSEIYPLPSSVMYSDLSSHSCVSAKNNIFIRINEFFLFNLLEPVYGLLYLYDFESKARVSETFYFDVKTKESNDSEKLLIDEKVKNDCNSCIVPFGGKKLESLYIIIRVEKTLDKGTIDKSLYYYFSGKNEQKATCKFIERILKVRQSMYPFRMPVGWISICLADIFDDKSDICLPTYSTTNRRGDSTINSNIMSFSESIKATQKLSCNVNLDSFIKMEGDDCSIDTFNKIIAENRSAPSGQKKEKWQRIYGTLSFDISRIHNYVPEGCFNTTGNKLPPTPNEPNQDIIRNDDKMVKLEAFSDCDSPKPYMQLINRMYLYPKFINLTSRSVSAKSLQLVFINMTRENSALFSNLNENISNGKVSVIATTPILYGSRSPFFYQEILFDLPTAMNYSNHLLIVVRNIVVSKNFVPSTNIVGYTWAPLYHDNKLIHGLHDLPLCFDPPPIGYSGTFPNTCDLQIRWIDGKKPLLLLDFRPMSSLHPKSSVLRSVFQRTYKLNAEISVEDPIAFVMNNIESLSKIEVQNLVESFPCIANCLLSMIDSFFVGIELVSANKDEFKNAIRVFRVFVDCVHAFNDATLTTVDAYNRNEYLAAYVSQLCFNRHISLSSEDSKKTSESKHDQTNFTNFHHKLVFLILSFSNDQRTISRITSLTWFYLEIILKSLCILHHQELSQEGKKITKVSEEFLKALMALIDQLQKEAQNYIKLNFHEKASFVCREIFAFLSNVSFVIDRTQTVRLLGNSLENVDIFQTGVSLFLCLNVTMGFIGISDLIFSDILMLLLNQANNDDIFGPKSACDFAELTYNYSKQYPVTSLILTSFKRCLISHAGSRCFSLIVSCIIHLLKKFEDVDDAFHKNVANSCNSLFVTSTDSLPRHRVSALFALLLFPYVDMVLGMVSNSFSTKESIKNFEDFVHDSYSNDLDTTGNLNNKSVTGHSFPTNLGVDCIRGILFIKIWIYRNVGQSFITHAWKLWNNEKKLVYMNSLLICLIVFSIDKEDEGVSDKLYKTSKSAKLNSLKNLILYKNSKSELWKSTSCTKPGTRTTELRGFVKFAKSKRSEIAHVDLENYMYGLYRLIGHETVYCITHTATVNIEPTYESQHVMMKCLSIFVKFLTERNPLTLHYHVLLTLQMYIKKFSILLSEVSAEELFNLVDALVTLCKSPFDQIRGNAIEILFVIIRIDYKYTNSIARIQLMLSLATSNCLANDTSLVLINNLKDSIYMLKDFSACHRSREFSTLVGKMATVLTSLLTSNFEDLTSKKDFHFKLDAMLQNADKFRNIPSLRIHWLMKIKDLLLTKDYHLHAGLCCVHSAIIVIQFYQTALTSSLFTCCNVQTFSRLTSNSVDEAFGTLANSSEKDQLCVTSMLSKDGFHYLINEAIQLFAKAMASSHAVLICELAFPILSAEKQYETLLKFNDLYLQSIRSLDKQGTDSKLCSYFSVTFHGSKLESLNNQTYIYCEPPHSKLSEFYSTITTSVSEMYPGEKVEIINNPKMSPVTSNTDNILIQVTYVYPLAKANYTLFSDPSSSWIDSRFFYYDTPFTMSGKSHGDVLDQYHRRTILETKAYLPYLVPRSKVISKKVIEFQPIDVIQSDVIKRAKELERVIMKNPPDYKILQLNLQGCIGTTVNQGPLNAVSLFLDPFILSNEDYEFDNSKDFKYLQSVNRLQLTCKYLMDLCQEALSRLSNFEKTSGSADYCAHMSELYDGFSSDLVH